MAARRQPLATVEEYLVRERSADHKSEYVAGQILAMAGGSKDHARISRNILSRLTDRLAGSPCEPFGSDLRVQAGSLITYPDVTVVCGKQRYLDADVDTLVNPTLLIEVLSPSTEGYDRGTKFRCYREIESLREYVLVSQDRSLVERFVVVEGAWQICSAVEDLEEEVPLESLGLTLRMADLYRDVEFPPDLPSAAPGTPEPAP